MARSVFSDDGEAPLVTVAVRNLLGAPVPFAKITVTTGGSSASLYSDPTLVTSKPNPLTANGEGVVAYYAAPGTYHHTATGASGIAAIEDVTVHGGAGGGSGSSGSGSGLPSTVVAVAAAHTAASGEFVEADATAAGFTVTLPSAPTVGALVTVKKVDAGANAVTVAPGGAGTIDGDANASIVAQNAGGVFEHVGSDAWKVTATLSYPSGALPASGVTAGSYGDATHVAQVTFDAQGRATAASAVAITTANALGTAQNPVTDAAAARPTGLTTVWWLTATQPTNYVAATDIWLQ